VSASSNQAMTYASGDELLITRLFKDDSLILTVRRAIDSAVVGRARLGLPGFRVANATGVVYYLKYSAGGTIPAVWVDDIRVRALNAVPPDEPVPTSLSFDSPSLRVDVGWSKPLTVEVRDGNGLVLDAADLTWTARTPSIATVAQTGNLTAQVTGVAPGTAWIVAQDGLALDSVQVTVGADAIEFNLGEATAPECGLLAIPRSQRTALRCADRLGRFHRLR